MFQPPIVALKMAEIRGQKNAGGCVVYNTINVQYLLMHLLVVFLITA